jgi:Zn-dependent protease
MSDSILQPDSDNQPQSNKECSSQEQTPRAEWRVADGSVPVASLADGALLADVVAEAVDEGDKPPIHPNVLSPRKRRVRLPLILFAITCFSTFFAGATDWVPFEVINRCFQPSYAFGVFGVPTEIDLMPIRRALVSHWADGLIYMVCVLAILFTHEMGHFLATVRYRIPASLPYFLPLPISPIGTLGAVIGMDGTRADRKQMFDIGLAGPLAGLVVAIPIMWVGITRLDLTQSDEGLFYLDLPLLTKVALAEAQPPGYSAGAKVWNTQLNAYFMAGWVGLLITGLNMLPVSQLDGGHVIYALFRKRAHWIARLFMLIAIIYIVAAWQWNLMLMFTLVMFIGTDHPPTRDDSVPLGWFRWLLGLLSLAIPLLCFAPKLIMG